MPIVTGAKTIDAGSAEAARKDAEIDRLHKLVVAEREAGKKKRASTIREDRKEGKS